jgi:hypothetical protein
MWLKETADFFSHFFFNLMLTKHFEGIATARKVRFPDVKNWWFLYGLTFASVKECQKLGFLLLFKAFAVHTVL